MVILEILMYISMAMLMVVLVGMIVLCALAFFPELLDEAVYGLEEIKTMFLNRRNKD